MLPLVFDIFIPVAIKELRKYLGLDRTLVHLFFAFLVQLVAFLVRLLGVFGPHCRDEGDLLAVARPDAVTRIGGDVGDLPGLAAVEADDPKLVRARAVRLEQDRLAVGTPARVPVLLARGIRKLARF